MREIYVYILPSRSRTLYTGVTNDLQRRVYEHKMTFVEGFTTKYNIERLVYFESTEDVHAAISREKQIKGWRRSKKIALIESANPTWTDLSEGWFEKEEKSGSFAYAQDEIKGTERMLWKAISLKPSRPTRPSS